MKKLIIIGAGSVGGFIAYNHSHLKDQYRVIGFLDDDLSKVGKYVFNYPVLGTTEDVLSYRDCSFIVGIAFPKIKKKIIDKLESYQLTYLNYISPSAWISEKVQIGKGVIIYPGVHINYEAVIHNFVTINMNAVVGHNCILDDFTTLAPGVCLAGHTHCYKGVDMGINSATRQNVQIGKYTIVGGQAMVLNDISEDKIVVGIPAKEI